MTDLRPLTASEMLDRAVRLYRRNFVNASRIVLTTAVPVAILMMVAAFLFPDTIVMTRTTYGVPNPSSNLMQQIVSFFDSILNIWVLGSLTFYFSRTYLDQDCSVGQALQTAWSRYGSLFGAYWFLILAAVLPILVLALIIPFFPFVGLIWTMYASVRWSVYSPALLAENLGARASLSRSWALTSGQFGRIVGINLLSTLFIFVIAQIPGMLLIYGLNQVQLPAYILSALDHFFGALTSLATLPIGQAITLILYYDLRVRKEGFDLQLEVDASAPAPSEPPMPTPLGDPE